MQCRIFQLPDCVFEIPWNSDMLRPSGGRLTVFNEIGSAKGFYLRPASCSASVGACFPSSDWPVKSRPRVPQLSEIGKAMGMLPDSAIVVGALALSVVCGLVLPQVSPHRTYCQPVRLISPVIKIDWTSFQLPTENGHRFEFRASLRLRSNSVFRLVCHIVSVSPQHLFSGETYAHKSVS
jgi:hypothetical protein